MKKKSAMNLDQIIQIFLSSHNSLKIVYSGLFQLFQSGNGHLVLHSHDYSSGMKKVENLE